MNKDRVLVVDDESLVRESIGDCLSSEFELYEAENGVQALEVLATVRPDLIITDYNMPHMDGHELIKTLQERKIEIPVICLTGRGSADIHKEMWIRGAFEYLEKPFNPENLIRRVQTAIATSGSLYTESQFRKLAQNLDMNVSVTLKPHQLDILRKIALSEGVSLSTLLGRWVSSKIEAHGKVA